MYELFLNSPIAYKYHSWESESKLKSSPRIEYDRNYHASIDTVLSYESNSKIESALKQRRANGIMIVRDMI